jgi:hypothetical protein
MAYDLGCCWMLFSTVEKGLLARARRMLCKLLSKCIYCAKACEVNQGLDRAKFG